MRASLGVRFFFCDRKITNLNHENNFFTKNKKRLRMIYDSPQLSQNEKFCSPRDCPKESLICPKLYLFGQFCICYSHKYPNLQKKKIAATSLLLLYTHLPILNLHLLVFSFIWFWWFWMNMYSSLTQKTSNINYLSNAKEKSHVAGFGRGLRNGYLIFDFTNNKPNIYPNRPTHVNSGTLVTLGSQNMTLVF